MSGDRVIGDNAFGVNVYADKVRQPSRLWAVRPVDARPVGGTPPGR